MIEIKDLRHINQEYFNVIQTTAFTITIQSKNTKHYWHISEQDYPSFKSYIIYHRHNATQQYHRHGHAGSLQKVISSIKSHDAFQLNGRKIKS